MPGLPKDCAFYHICGSMPDGFPAMREICAEAKTCRFEAICESEIV